MPIGSQMAGPMRCQGIDISSTTAPSPPSRRAVACTLSSTPASDSSSAEALLDDPDPHSLDSPADGLGVRLRLGATLAAVDAVIAGNNLEQKSAIGDGSRHRPDMIKGEFNELGRQKTKTS